MVAVHDRAGPAAPDVAERAGILLEPFDEESAPYPRRPDVSGLLEPKGRMTRILLEALERLIGKPLDLWGEVPIRGQNSGEA